MKQIELAEVIDLAEYKKKKKKPVFYMRFFPGGSCGGIGDFEEAIMGDAKSQEIKNPDIVK